MSQKEELPPGATDAESVKKRWKEQAEQIRTTAEQVAGELQKNANRQNRTRQRPKR